PAGQHFGRLKIGGEGGIPTHGTEFTRWSRDEGKSIASRNPRQRLAPRRRIRVASGGHSSGHRRRTRGGPRYHCWSVAVPGAQFHLRVLLGGGGHLQRRALGSAVQGSC